MRNLVFLLFLGVFSFAVAGWFLDWYSIGGGRTPEGQRRVSIDFDTQKIGADLAKGRDKLQEAIDDWQHDENFVGPLPAPNDRRSP
jgi:hypothetical protein